MEKIPGYPDSSINLLMKLKLTGVSLWYNTWKKGSLDDSENQENQQSIYLKCKHVAYNSITT